MEFLAVDRIEESGIAVCEDENGKEWIIAPKYLPIGAREGMILTVNGKGKLIINTKLTEKRRAEILRLLDELKA